MVVRLSNMAALKRVCPSLARGWLYAGIEDAAEQVVRVPGCSSAVPGGGSGLLDLGQHGLDRGGDGGVRHPTELDGDEVWGTGEREDQAAGRLADQVEVCRRYIERNGWTLTRCYDDAAISGASTHQRPGYRRLLSDAEAGLFDVLVCEAVDRLGRNLADVARGAVERSLNGIMMAIEGGAWNEILRVRLTELEVRRTQIEAELATAVVPALVTLHPNAAGLYAARVGVLLWTYTVTWR